MDEKALYAVRRVHSETKNLSAEALFDEFQQLAITGRAEVWNLASHNIEPQLIRKLFAMIGSSGITLHTPIAVDLDDNRLNNAQVDDFKVTACIVHDFCT